MLSPLTTAPRLFQRLSFRRSPWSYHKVQLARSAMTRDREPFMNLKKPGLILDVGCGPNVRPENINLDYHWRPGVDVCCDITKGLPFPESYVGGIFTEHCLEHISFRSALFVLREFHRIIRPGGYVRIIIPDLAIYVDCYARAVPMPLADDDPMDGIYSPAMSINRIMRSHGHCFIYDFETMAQMIAAAGFVDVLKTKCGVSSDKRLLLDTPERAIESLYVEARRRNNDCSPR